MENEPRCRSHKIAMATVSGRDPGCVSDRKDPRLSFPVSEVSSANTPISLASQPHFRPLPPKGFLSMQVKKREFRITSTSRASSLKSGHGNVSSLQSEQRGERALETYSRSKGM